MSDIEDTFSKGSVFRLLAENIPVGISLIDTQGRYRYINRKFREMFGYELSDIPDGKAWFEKAYPDETYRNKVKEVWFRDFGLFKPGEKKPWIFTVTCTSGATKVINFMPVQLDTGEILIAYEDFTRLTMAQQAVEENEGKLQLLYEKSVDPIFIFDGERYIDCNDAALQIMGCRTKDELLRFHPLEISPEYQPDGQSSKEKGEKVIEKAKREGNNRFEWLHKNIEGKEFWVDVSLTTISFIGSMPLMYVFWHDITERKKAEIELKNSEERYRNMFDNIPFPTFVYDFDTLNIVDVNPSAVSNYGYSREELLGMKVADLKPDKDVPSLLAHLSKPDPSQEKGLWRHKKKDGTVIEVEITGHPLQFSDKNYRIFLANDITEMKKSEAALKFTQFAVDRAAVGVLWIGEKGDILYGNDEICRFLEYTRQELGCVNIFDIDMNNPEETWTNNLDHIRQLGSMSVESIFKSMSGKLFPVEITCNFMEYDGNSYVCMIIKDITDRKVTEEALKKREVELKIESNLLEEANTALKVLLKHREDDKKELEAKLISNIKELVLPYIEKIKKSRVDSGQSAYIDIIERNLNDILSPFLQQMSLKYSNFTPTEIQVANLIKAGKTSKEIADIMKVSAGTIDTHRNSIRSKLNLNKKKVNLRAYLISLG